MTNGKTKEAVRKLRLALKYRTNFKRAKDTLARLGFKPADDVETVIDGHGGQGWAVVSRSARYFAVNPAFDNVRVPLELLGTGKPKIVSWEEREAPYSNFGVLKFSAGVGEDVDGKPMPYEQAAIIDKKRGTVIAIQPHRAGKKVSEWTWGLDGRVRVASVDGYTDDLPIAVGVVAAAAAKAKAVARSRERRRRRRQAGVPAWAPWADDVWAQPSQKRKRRARRRRKKKKNFFQLLFNQ